VDAAQGGAAIQALVAEFERCLQMNRLVRLAPKNFF